MNILIVHNHYQIRGGEDTVVNNEYMMLKEKGNNVFLYEKDNVEISGYNLIKKIFLPINYLFNIGVYKDIKKIIKEKNIDIVHVHNIISIISPSVYYAAFDMKIPVVQTLHNFRLLCPNGLLYRDGRICEECLNSSLFNSIKHNCYRGSKLQTALSATSMEIQRKLGLYKKLYYICLTDFNRKKILDNIQIDEDHTFVKPNFSDNKYTIIPFDKRRNNIVLACRLEEYKGIKFIFNVWNQMPNDIELHVYGTGSLEQWCKNYISSNEIKNIKMKGLLANNLLTKEIAYSKGVILSSCWYEAFPMNIVESLSTGTPIITSDLGNPGCLIKEGISGFKYKHESIESCKEAIDRLLSNGNIYELCLNEYKDKYSKEKNHELLIKIYNDILSRKM